MSKPEKTQVDITLVARADLEVVVMKLQSENRLMAQQIISLNRTNRQLEHQTIQFGEALLAVRGVTHTLDAILGIGQEPTDFTQAECSEGDDKETDED